MYYKFTKQRKQKYKEILLPDVSTHSHAFVKGYYNNVTFLVIVRI